MEKCLSFVEGTAEGGTCIVSHYETRFFSDSIYSEIYSFWSLKWVCDSCELQDCMCQCVWDWTWATSAKWQKIMPVYNFCSTQGCAVNSWEAKGLCLICIMSCFHKLWICVCFQDAYPLNLYKWMVLLLSHIFSSFYSLCYPHLYRHSYCLLSAFLSAVFRVHLQSLLAGQQ